MGYTVIKLNCSGIPDGKLKPERFSDKQETVLTMLDASVQADIRKGVPYSVIDFESGQSIAEFNISNVKPSDFEKRMLASTLYEAVLKFYEKPENVKAFEKSKSKKSKAKKSKK